MSRIKEIVLVLWQLPQFLLGIILYKYYESKDRILEVFDYKGCRVVKIKSTLISGGSLGPIILLSSNISDKEIKHEYGHSIQSLIFGPLYLLLIGIPSAIFNNLWDRLFHKKWSYKDRTKWYYNRYPEKWADKLGGVIR